MSRDLVEDVSHIRVVISRSPKAESDAVMANPHPFLPPIYLPGQEPLPPGTTNDEREAYYQAKKWERIIGYVPETCPFKVVLSGGAGESQSLSIIFPTRSITPALPIQECAKLILGPRLRSRRFLLPHVRYLRLRGPPHQSLNPARRCRDSSSDRLRFQRDGSEYVVLWKGVREGRSPVLGDRMLYRGRKFDALSSDLMVSSEADIGSWMVIVPGEERYHQCCIRRLVCWRRARTEFRTDGDVGRRSGFCGVLGSDRLVSEKSTDRVSSSLWPSNIQ